MPADGEGRERRYSNAVLRRLRWPVARRLGVHAWGDERSRRMGPGVEYADVREYQWGEDARLIDWNLTARSDRPFVRESHPDRGLDVWLIVDTSRSLDWGTTYSLKRDVAAELLAAATLLLSRHGNRVGAILFDSELRRVLAPRAGRTGRLGLLARLESESARPSGDGKRTDLARTLARAGDLIRRPSLVLVVSDFLVEAGWQRPMRALSIRHELVAVRISDPREGELPDVGVVVLEYPETGAQIEVDTSGRGLRDRYRAAAGEQRRRLLADLRRAGVSALELTTAEPVLPQLVAYLRRREYLGSPRNRRFRGVEDRRGRPHSEVPA
jgi:uncharacterized protein (DUF58 family)